MIESTTAPLAKRLLDIFVASFGLLVASPAILVAVVLVWLQDFRSPFYIAPRIGKGGRAFKMVKIRSMVPNADKSGVDSTSASDMRLTSIGKLIRRFKLDELSQLWNVLKGDMSLVGPRPNVKRGTDVYTDLEKRLLSVEPGVTDFASIVFADEGEILKDRPDPDAAYDRLIRPWKSRLGLFYIDHRSLGLDIRLILLTALAIPLRERGLTAVSRLLAGLGAPNDLVRVALRHEPLQPTMPPGERQGVRP